MIAELGQFALILALGVALVQGIVPLLGAYFRIGSWLQVAHSAAQVQFALLLLAYLALSAAFVDYDFSVAYVAQNSNTALPLFYRLAAVWGAHEGSMLLWVFILSVWGLMVSLLSRGLPLIFIARVLAVMGWISIGLLLFMIMTSNPFERLFPVPLEGRDLNPLLQDPGMVMHPPLLYLGYVGFSVAFSFAIAALIGGQLDAAWARWSRPWTLMAWMFLTIGIALGSWWAYNELGWGGWWFWDPVENASFMPWLVGTALIHSLAVTEQRGALKSWTVLLAIFAFSLSLLGTFLVRSGVLVSVHAFATDPARGVFILAFLTTVIGGSLLLYGLRAHTMQGGSQFAPVSRETGLLLNNVFFVVAAAAVLLGTLYPLALDALGVGKISVGPPYFTSIFAPLMLPMVFLAGMGFWTRWKHDEPARLARVFLPLLGVAVGVTVALWVLLATDNLPMLLGILASVWVMLSALTQWLSRPLHGLRGFAWLVALPRSFVGMNLAHFGLGVFTLGIIFVNMYSVERDVSLKSGEQVELAGYRFVLEDIAAVQGPNYQGQRGRVRVFQGEHEVALLEPEKRTYRVQANAMTEAAVDIGALRDLYVSLGEPLGGDAWSLRVYYKPLIRWIWLGAVLMALGGLLAASDRRYRLPRPVAVPGIATSAQAVLAG